MKFIITLSIFISLLLVTSTIKNKTRVIEKNISNLNTKILYKTNEINEAQLDFHYLSSPAEIEKKLTFIGFDNYQPIKYSSIFFNISDFTAIQKKISILKI
jgi:cell division protein FtsL